MTRSAFNKMYYNDQGRMCAMNNCQSPATCIDHDHQHGNAFGKHRVRGILCRPCNLALGFVNDDINILESAKLYLLKCKSSSSSSS